MRFLSKKYFLIAFLIIGSRAILCQKDYIPYPIIFVHGLASSYETWGGNNSIIQQLQDKLNLNSPKVFHVCLNNDGNVYSALLENDVEAIGWTQYGGNTLLAPTEDDRLFLINFNNSKFPVSGHSQHDQSNQSAIYKQGYALKLMIEEVLSYTNAQKVILVGHSMGGLAIREYLQRTENGDRKWWISPMESDGHEVVKVVTIGTPHLGSDYINIDGFIPILTSEAVRDLRYRYNDLTSRAPNTDYDNGVYLFGGDETFSDLSNFVNSDINCNGNEVDYIEGLNSGAVNGRVNPFQTLPSSIEYTWITSDNGGLGDGDGVVRRDRQYLWNIGDTLLTNESHLTETSDYNTLIRGLDEPDKHDYAFEIKLHNFYKGFAATQGILTDNPSPNTDYDWYKISFSGGYLSILLTSSGTGGGRIDFYKEQPAANENSTVFTTFSSNYAMELETPLLNAGEYYIRITHSNVNKDDWQTPYSLSINKKQILPVPKLSHAEYFLDVDPGLGNASPINIDSSSYQDISFVAELKNVEFGIHNLYVRVRDEFNKWSLNNCKLFLKQHTVNASETKIVKMEYYFDYDPGFGKGIDVPITPGDSISNSSIIDLTDLDEGQHTLNVRSMDGNNKWSHNISKLFLKERFVNSNASEITYAEYFIDDDPGFGKGNDIPITSAKYFEKFYVIDLSGVSPGMHVVNIRVKDENGHWSINYSRPFIKQNVLLTGSTQISMLEYFFDEDPGIGQGNIVTIVPDTIINKSFVADLSLLEYGKHIFFVRAIDVYGNGSFIHSSMFYKSVRFSNANISQDINDDRIYFFQNSNIVNTAISINFTGVSRSGVIRVQSLSNPPTNVTGTAANFSKYRWLITNYGLLFDEAELRIHYNLIPNSGIINPADVMIYKRDTEGTGEFTALETETGNYTIFANLSTFGEIILSSETNPLPVQLSTFSLRKSDYKVLINWRTETEINCSRFEIERAISLNDQDSLHLNFAKIGYIEGNGNTNSPKEYSFIDREAVGGSKFYYRLKIIDNDGSVEYSDQLPIDLVPSRFKLYQNYPNPFNPATTIKFDVPTSTNVLVELFNSLGERVKVLISENKKPGTYNIHFNAANLASGAYFYRITASQGFTDVKKIIVLK